MSRYSFKANGKQFDLGWDNPLQYYFLSVEPLDADGNLLECTDDEEPTYLFNNLDLKEPGMSLSQVTEIVRMFGSDIPDDIMTGLRLDPERERFRR